MMKFIILFFSIIGTVVSALWPIPTTIEYQGNKTVWASPDLSIDFIPPSAKSHIQNPSFDTYEQIDNAYIQRTRDRVTRAISRTKIQLFGDKYVPWKSRPRDSNFAPSYNPGKSTSLQKVIVTQHQEDPKSSGTDDPIDESYNLTMKVTGSRALVYINAYTSVGILRGLTTLSQMFYATMTSEEIYTNMAPISIQDKPKFSHRGLNLDVARAWYPKADIMRTMDAMSWNKMNRLHLHMTDAQSWPIFINSMPDLANKGAFAPGLFYTVGDITELMNYAYERGIQVLVEIDMPGHTQSVSWSYPDLIAAANIQPNWQDYSAEPPSGQFKLNYPPVKDFITRLCDDLLPRLGSEGALWFHTGGDEINKNVYNLDNTVESNDSAVIQPLLEKFIENTHNDVRRNGLTPVVWEEILLDWNVTLDKDVIVQSWISADSVLAIVEKGHRVIAGSYQYWYLDCGHGGWLDPKPDFVDSYFPFNDYCTPIKNWRLVYSYDPIAGIPEDLQHLVLGGEVHQWSEQADPSVIDSLLWPRAAAAAEVLWSTNKLADGTNRTYADASFRLFEQRERMVRRGVGAGVVQMTWCKQNEHGCELGLDSGG